MNWWQLDRFGNPVSWRRPTDVEERAKLKVAVRDGRITLVYGMGTVGAVRELLRLCTVHERDLVDLLAVDPDLDVPETLRRLEDGHGLH